jgi:hypothetical protein
MNDLFVALTGYERVSQSYKPAIVDKYLSFPSVKSSHTRDHLLKARDVHINPGAPFATKTTYPCRQRQISFTYSEPSGAIFPTRRPQMHGTVFPQNRAVPLSTVYARLLQSCSTSRSNKSHERESNLRTLVIVSSLGLPMTNRRFS